MRRRAIDVSRRNLFAAVFVVFGSGLGMPQTGAAAGSTLRNPECAEVVDWVATIDLSDQYQPLENAPYDKLPAAYGTAKFAAVFGKPALEWTQAELHQMYNHVLACGRNAGREYKKKVRPLSRNLRNVLVMQSRKNGESPSAAGRSR